MNFTSLFRGPLGWFLCWVQGPRLHFGGFIGGGDKKQTTVNTSYQDAFNSSVSNIQSSGDAGNVSFSLGGGSGSGGLLDGVLPVVFAGLLLFGGLWLVTRRN